MEFQSLHAILKAKAVFLSLSSFTEELRSELENQQFCLIRVKIHLLFLKRSLARNRT
jgi:hypothetical protein